MLIIITVASILGITVLVRLAEKILPFKVCPICAGVFLTWTGMLTANFLGYQVPLVIPAFLMGGTVVGIAYQLEKKYSASSTDARLLLKALFIPAGFVAAYGILLQLWAAALLAIAFLFLISLVFLSPNGKADPHGSATEEIEKKMKDCC